MGGRKDLQSFSKHSRMPIIRVTRGSVSGSAILFLNPSLQTKLTDDYAVGSIDPDKSQGKCAVLGYLWETLGHHRQNSGFG